MKKKLGNNKIHKTILFVLFWYSSQVPEQSQGKEKTRFQIGSAYKYIRHLNLNFFIDRWVPLGFHSVSENFK